MAPATATQPLLTDLGDPEGWIDEHGDALLRFALVRVGDVATAEDLVQETLLSAWRGRDSFDGGCEPRTWLVAIMRRRIADYFRRAGRRPKAVDQPVDETAQGPLRTDARPTDATAEDAEFWTILSRCTSDLPEHLARAFRLRTFGDEAPTEICDAEGISRKNLSVRLHRARTLLRQCLERRWFGEGSSEGSLR